MAMTGGTSKLVHTGIPNYGAATSYPIKLYVYYKSTQDNVNNQSTVTVGMYVVVASGWNIGPWTDYNGSYVGTTDLTFTGSIKNITGTVWLAENKSFTVDHDSDGSKKVTIYWKWGVNSPYGQFENESGSFQITLPTIPRASTIGATDANIGAKSTITVTRKSTSYSHSIKYTFGSVSGYIKADGSVSTSEVKIIATSISFTVPTAFYAQIPKATYGTCTLTITTYSGSTQIGSAQTTTFKATAAKADCAPTVSGTVVDTNDTTIALTGNSSKLIRYASTALCTIVATAKNSATISSKTIGGTAVTADTRTIDKIESASVKFAATDSRGYETSVTLNKSLLSLWVAYIKLTANIVFERVDPTSGRATLTISGDYFNDSFGAQGNSLSIKYKIAKSGSSYGDEQSVEAAIDGNTYSVSIDLTDLDYEYSHNALVTVSDALTVVSKVATVSQGIPVFDWGEKDFRFNKPVLLTSESYGTAYPENPKKGQVFLLQNDEGGYTIHIYNGSSWI